MDRLPADVLPAPLEKLLAESDYVVVTCPLTPQTHHMINARTLGLMKKTAWIVNVGRGAVIDERALVESLRERKIAGAMLDVYENYRLTPEHELLKLDNVVLTPHLAGNTAAARGRASVMAAQEMLRMLAGERPLNLVNPEAWEAACARA
jgi:D-3-phosphoglycerate dehydrogenase